MYKCNFQKLKRINCELNSFQNPFLAKSEIGPSRPKPQMLTQCYSVLRIKSIVCVIFRLVCLSWRYYCNYYYFRGLRTNSLSRCIASRRYRNNSLVGRNHRDSGSNLFHSRRIEHDTYYYRAEATRSPTPHVLRVCYVRSEQWRSKGMPTCIYAVGANFKINFLPAVNI